MMAMKYILIGCFIAASAFSQQKPAWVDAPQSIYPADRYLTAIGVGDTRKSAENDAAANLATIFQSTIKAEQTVTDRYKELFTSPAHSTLEHQNETTKNISVSSDQTLYNVQYAESFTDNTGRTYILAVLERQPTADIYQKKIEENEALMDSCINQSIKANDPILKYAYMNAAYVFDKINEPLKNQLTIIIPGMTYQSKSKYDDVKVQKMLLSARKGIPFALNIQGDGEGTISNAVKGMLTDQGFIIKKDGLLTITGSVEFEDIDLHREEKFVRWSYALSVVDMEKTTLASFSEKGREGHLSASEARARAKRTMTQKIQTDFSGKLNEYFDGLVRK